MHTVYVTCAGESTRFPGQRPKWSLTHPDGDMMCAAAVRGMSGYDRLVFVFREDHLAAFGGANVLADLRTSLPDTLVEVLGIPATRHQVQTVAEAIKRVPPGGGFTVKDCDNRFRYRCSDENMVALVSLNDYAHPVVARNKSYATVQTHGEWITELAEKEIISPYFCCGAYSFEDEDAFYAGLRDDGGPAFLSQLINGVPSTVAGWRPQWTEGYEDWGTAEDWARYCASYVTLFVDVDGVLVENGHRTFPPRWGDGRQIAANIEYLNRLHETGRVEIVLCTSRPESERVATARQLDGLQYDRLLMGFRSCARVLINDSRTGTPTKMARAVNVERNAATLAAELGGGL